MANKSKHYLPCCFAFAIASATFNLRREELPKRRIGVPAACGFCTRWDEEARRVLIPGRPWLDYILACFLNDDLLGDVESERRRRDDY